MCGTVLSYMEVSKTVFWMLIGAFILGYGISIWAQKMDDEKAEAE